MVNALPTPNPNAMKFTVGQDVGGPGTFVKGQDAEEDFVTQLLAIEGVASIFMTADFVTISKETESDWAGISADATAILEARFGS